MSQPNIVLIVSDDHGYADRSARGTHPEVHTPNLDRLADTGITFEQGYVSAPICSPSRAGLITGTHQQRWGAYWFDTSAMAGPEYPSMAEVLKGVGYRTGYFGKVHYGPEGPGDRGTPPRHGFDESFYGLAGQSSGRLHYLQHSAAVRDADPGLAGITGTQPMWDGAEEVDCTQHLTVEFAQRARDFIGDGSTAQPFFAMVAFNAVHNFTWQLPDDELARRNLPAHPDFDGQVRYLDWYDGAIEPNLPNGREYYLAQLELMDAQIGALLDHLEATGQSENTIVVYLTDNGGSHCNYGSNAPLSGTKYTLFEGGVRVPYLVRWPAVVAAGTRSTALVSSLDLLPTFAAAAGASIPETVDGIDLAPVLAEPAAPAHDQLHFDTGFQWAVRTPEWKLRWVDPDSPVRADTLLVEHTDMGQGLQLSRLDASPTENQNLAADHPEVVAELTGLHQAWKAQLGTAE